jgi:hypothetical protein
METIRLPNTSPENRLSYTHVKLLTAVHPQAWNAAGFEGTLHAAGGRIPAAELPRGAIALEYAGPQGAWKRHPRENLWILWRFDQEAQDWREIARASAFGWEWALILRQPAIEALRPPAAEAPRGAGARGREVTAELLRTIDSAVSLELPAVRMTVLASVYDSLAGRLAAEAV